MGTLENALANVTAVGASVPALTDNDEVVKLPYSILTVDEEATVGAYRVPIWNVVFWVLVKYDDVTDVPSEQLIYLAYILQTAGARRTIRWSYLCLCAE